MKDFEKIKLYDRLHNNQGAIKQVAARADVSRNTIRNFFKLGKRSKKAAQIILAADLVLLEVEKEKAAKISAMRKEIGDALKVIQKAVA